MNMAFLQVIIDIGFLFRNGLVQNGTIAAVVSNADIWIIVDIPFLFLLVIRNYKRIYSLVPLQGLQFHCLEKTFE